MMRGAWAGLFLLLFTAGCAHVPFRETALVPIGAGDPWAVIERFRARMPERFQLLNTVVFEYHGRTIAGIGSVQVSRPDATFTVAFMNPLGVKLFELSGDRNSVTSRYSITDLSRYGDFANAVGVDVRRVYFDLVPGPGARVGKRRTKLFFQEVSGAGRMEYVFAGEQGDLIEKNYYEDDGIVWKAAYYEYRDQDGKRWPQGIVFIHYQYGYRLTVRQKELSI